MHWGVGLNKKTVARFFYPKDSADLRLMIGGPKCTVDGVPAVGRRFCTDSFLLPCLQRSGRCLCLMRLQLVLRIHGSARGSNHVFPAGDELRLRHPCPRVGSPPWVGIGFVARLDDASEEVAIELRSKEKGQSSAPTDVTTGFVGAGPAPRSCCACCAPLPARCRPALWCP